jgi:hypothetical protein
MAEYIERTEELMLAMNAGARAIENTKRYHVAVYTKDVFSESPQEIPYLQAAKVLRQASDVTGADVAPVVHGRDVYKWHKEGHCEFKCSVCGAWAGIIEGGTLDGVDFDYCPNCGAKMDGGDGDAAD